MQVIAVGNQKGGVGKTTTTVNLAAALGTLGRRSLIIDLDANCGATRSLGVPPESYQGSNEMLIGLESPLDLALATDPDEGIELPQGVELIPANRDLERVDVELAQKHRFTDYRDCLRKPIDQLKKSNRYDYVFLDTAPNIATPTVAAYRVAEWFILTAVPERLAIDGLNDAMSDIQTVRESNNPNLRLLGVVLSCVDRRTRLANELVRWVEEAFEAAGIYGDFKTRVGRAVAVPQAQQQGKTIFQTEPSHKVAEQYRQIAREMEDRIVETLQPSLGSAQPEQSQEIMENWDAPAMPDARTGKTVASSPSPTPTGSPETGDHASEPVVIDTANQASPPEPTVMPQVKVAPINSEPVSILDKLISARAAKQVPVGSHAERNTPNASETAGQGEEKAGEVNDA